MNLLSLEDLPVEIIEKIAEYFSLEDVRACSSVNSVWRAIFDNNRIWKRYYTFHPKYFHCQKSKLGHSSGDDCEGCEAKQIIFKELRVQKNLFNCKFHTDEVKIDGLICWKLTDVIDEVGNHWLFILGKNKFACSIGKCQLQAWKLNKDPILISSIDNVQVGEVQELCLKIKNNKVFVMLRKSTLVYKFSYPHYQLQFLFKVDAPKVLEPFRSRFVCTNNLILCFFHKIYNNTEAISPNVHIWTDNGSLVFKKDGFPRQENILKMFYLRAVESDSSDCVLIATNHVMCSLGEAKDVLQFFCTKKFHYTTILNERENRSLNFMLLPRNLVCVLYQQQYTGLMILKCFNSGGVVISNITLVEPDVEWRLFSSCQDGKVVVLGKSKMLVLDILKQKEVNRFTIDTVELGSLHTGLWLKNNLLYVQGSSYDQVTTSVLNIKTGQQVKRLKSFPPHKTSLCSVSYFNNGENRSPPKIFVEACQDESGPPLSCRVFVVSFW